MGARGLSSVVVLNKPTTPRCGDEAGFGLSNLDEFEFDINPFAGWWVHHPLTQSTGHVRTDHDSPYARNPRDGLREFRITENRRADPHSTLGANLDARTLLESTNTFPCRSSSAPARLNDVSIRCGE